MVRVQGFCLQISIDFSERDHMSPALRRKGLALCLAKGCRDSLVFAPAHWRC